MGAVEGGDEDRDDGGGVEPVDPVGRGEDVDQGGGVEPVEPVDPFEGLVLDASFVAAAVHLEATAAERVRRPEPRPIQPVGGVRPRVRRRLRRVSPARRLVLVAVVLFVAVVAGAVAVDRSRPAGPGTVAPPWLDGEHSGVWVGVAPAVDPPPVGSTSRVLPPVRVETTGAHAFLDSAASDDPVTWDPCRTVPFVLSETGLPDGADDLLVDALADVRRLTGLDLQLEGRTAEVPTPDRAAVQPDRYGDRWAPVLVAWTDPGTVPELAGDVAGMAGPLGVRAPSGRPADVTGAVLLDRPDLDAIEADDGRDAVAAVVLHELGHLVGLDHVDDAGELMYPVGRRTVTTFGPGDRAGLARLGQGPCAPDL